MDIYIYKHIHTNVHKYIHIHIHTYIHTHAYNIHICINKGSADKNFYLTNRILVVKERG